MIAAPPVDVGAVKVTLAVVWPVAVPTTLVGALEATIGSVVIDVLELEAEEVATLFVAVTVNV